MPGTQIDASATPGFACGLSPGYAVSCCSASVTQ